MKRAKTDSTEETMDSEAVVLVETKKIELQKRVISSNVGDNDVIINVTNVGICGSDVEYWQRGRIGDFVLKAPMVIGHESAGVVVKCGKNVKSLQVGDRVAMEPGIPCRHCRLCLGGKYNLCEEMRFFATPPVDGSLCTYIHHPADFCFKIPDSVSLEEAAMCEPLSVGVHACERAHIGMGSRVLILGCGPIGIICLLVAKAFGAEWVAMTDVRDDRLEKAAQLGADLTVKVAGLSHEAIVASIKKQSKAPIDASIECCGLESATRLAIAATASGGTVCCVGLHDTTMNVPLMDAAVREVDIRGIFRYRNTYAKCVSMLATKRVDVTPLITHRFPVKEFLAAFEAAHSPESKSIKVMINLR